MLIPDLNFYSLLVPSIMSGLGIITLSISYYKGLPHYLSSYAYALMLLGVTILLNTVLSAPVLAEISSVIAVLYFLSCTFQSKAIYERLNIRYLWPTYLYLIAIGSFGIYYFTQVSADQTARLLIIGFITADYWFHYRSHLFTSPDDFYSEQHTLTYRPLPEVFYSGNGVHHHGAWLAILSFT